MKKWINVEEIGQLYLEKILVTFDIPILFVCSNGKNKKYLCLNIGDEDGTTVIAEISKATLSAMQQNKIPMEAVYRQAIGKKLIIAKYDKYPYGKPQTDEVARGSGNREYGCRRLREKLPNFSGVSFFRAGNSNSLTNAFHICVYVHLCVVPRYIASQHPWKQSQSLLQNTKETTAGHFRRSVFLLSGRIPGVHELLWKAASLSCGRYR